MHIRRLTAFRVQLTCCHPTPAMTCTNNDPRFPFDVELLIQTCRAADVVFLGVFGSMARGDWTGSSDIDLLIRFRQPVGLIELIALKYTLSEELGWDADLLTENAIDPLLREDIMKDLVILYSDNSDGSR